MPDGESTPSATAGLNLGPGKRSLIGWLRDADAMPWLGRRMTYTLCAPLLTLAGAATTVAAPLLLAPARFGDYVLLLAVFQYACALDLGLSQLADKALAGRERTEQTSLADLVRSRCYVAGAAVLLALPLSFALARSGGALTAANLFLAAAAGIAFMLSNGPVTLYRASSRIWEFTFAALVMQAGLSVPRLGGLLLGGIPGCFGVLAAFYALTAVLLTQPFSALLHTSSAPRAVRRTLGAALPLFVFNAVWLLYLTANRWIASALLDPEAFGLFAFGTNLVAVGVGLLMTIGQVHYPKHLGSDGGPDAQSLLERDLLHLVGLTAVGSLAGVLACRFAVPVVFPHFAAAAESSAALVASLIPLGMAGCVMPLVVARSQRPVRDTVAVFVASFGVLGVGMVMGNAIGGISGQAWGCTIASLVPPVIQVGILSRHSMLRRPQVNGIVAAACGAIVVDALVWGLLFHH